MIFVCSYGCVVKQNAGSYAKLQGKVYFTNFTSFFQSSKFIEKNNLNAQYIPLGIIKYYFFMLHLEFMRCLKICIILTMGSNLNYARTCPTIENIWCMSMGGGSSMETCFRLFFSSDLPSCSTCVDI